MKKSTKKGSTKKRRIVMGVMIAAAVTAGCSANKAGKGMLSREILTTTPVEQDKTMITVRVEFGAGQQSDLEEVLEEKFPNVDIVLQHDGSSSSVHTVKANLEQGVECDLILSRRLNTVADIAPDYLLDLSDQDFINNYYMSAVDSCSTDDGKVFFLPGPSDVYGIVYDKTMFEENGWEVPNSYSGFVKLLRTIKHTNLKTTVKDEEGNTKKTTVTPIQVSMMYPDMFQILFNTYGYEEVYSGVANYTWLTEYQQGKGTMVGHMEGAVEKFRQLYEDGMLSLTDLETSPSRRSEMMYLEHSTAMIIECQNAVKYAAEMAQEQGETEDAHQLAMMPFYVSDHEDSDYLYSIPSYYMAINKSAAEESSKKKKLLLEIYDYLSSQEGQEVLLDGNFQISNVQGVSLEKNEFSEGILDTIERGQVINTMYLAEGETDKQVERQLLATVGDMVKGDMSVDDWLKAGDKTRDAFLAGDLNRETSYGTVEETMTRLESAYTVAEMYRSLTDAQIGICLGGGYDKSTNGYFYEGDITDSSLSCVTPQKEPTAEGSENKKEGKIVVSSLTGAEIKEILNNAGSAGETKGLYPYYVASGLNVTFNPWGKEGERVLSCTLKDGSSLEADKTYKVAYYYGSLPETYDTETVLDKTWQEAFLTWLENKGGKLKKPDMTITLQYES
jgi:ABC-type glycerol-3-phosphate transport system substrate-binding protein